MNITVGAPGSAVLAWPQRAPGVRLDGENASHVSFLSAQRSERDSRPYDSQPPWIRTAAAAKRTGGCGDATRRVQVELLEESAMSSVTKWACARSCAVAPRARAGGVRVWTSSRNHAAITYEQHGTSLGAPSRALRTC
eukprot:7109714-Prymnesium_polylepis.2